MVIEVFKNGEWVDVVQYISSDSVDGSYEDVSGPNAEKNILGTPILDVVNVKYSLQLVTKYLNNEEASFFKEIFRDSVIEIRTDYFEDALTVYDGYRGTVLRSRINDKWSKYSVVIDCYRP